MKAVVVAGGSCPDATFLKERVKEVDLIVAVDRGADHLWQCGIVPHVFVGDSDSCSSEVVHYLQTEDVSFVKLPAAKNETDLEVALDYCCKEQYKHAEVLAAIEGERIDHFLGTVLLLPKYLKCGMRVSLLDSGGRLIELIESEVLLTGKQGTYVSLLPITSEVKGVTTEGLKYALKGETLYMGATRGVSNEIVDSQVRITAKGGMLLVVREKDQ